MVLFQRMITKDNHIQWVLKSVTCVPHIYRHSHNNRNKKQKKLYKIYTHMFLSSSQHRKNNTTKNVDVPKKHGLCLPDYVPLQLENEAEVWGPLKNQVAGLLPGWLRVPQKYKHVALRTGIRSLRPELTQGSCPESGRLQLLAEVWPLFSF